LLRKSYNNKSAGHILLIFARKRHRFFAASLAHWWAIITVSTSRKVIRFKWTNEILQSDTGIYWSGLLVLGTRVFYTNVNVQ